MHKTVSTETLTATFVCDVYVDILDENTNAIKTNI